MTPTITTVIPTFRRPTLLGRAIRSVLGQTNRDCAVAVFDNASGDETPAVVAAIAATDPRVTYHRQERNVGIVPNFITAMRSVESPYFTVLSDDDVLFPEFFDTALRSLEQHPAAMFFAGSTLEFDERGELRNVPMAYWPREGEYPPAEALPLMLGNRHPTLSGVMFRRSLVDAIGVMDPDVGAAADFDYEMRAAARFPIVISFQPCAAWVSHRASQSGGETAAIAASYEKILANIEAIAELDKDLKTRTLAGFRRQVRGKLLEISVKAQVRGDAAASQEAARRLRDRYGARFLGAALLIMSALCNRMRVFQRLLQWLEARRLEMRAARSRRRAGSNIRDLARYAGYMRPPQESVSAC